MGRLVRGRPGHVPCTPKGVIRLLERLGIVTGWDAGKPVLCEKPLAGDLDSARGLVRAAAQTGLPTACGFENRWNADWLAVAAKVHSGFLGKPYLARVSRSASYWHPDHPPQAAWMYDRDQGGGYLAGMLVHDIDFLCSAFGRPQSVCAEVRTSEPVRDLPDGGRLAVTADDTAALLMRMECGVIAILSVSVMGAHTGPGVVGVAYGAFPHDVDLPPVAR